jgi:hypothetical protein
MTVQINTKRFTGGDLPTWKEIVYWNTTSYGMWIRIKKWVVHTANTTLATILPFVYPIPISLAINKYCIKNDIKWRYEKK